MDLSQYQEEFKSITDFLKEDLAGLRTGRANAAMVENIMVDAYGSKMPMKGVASINIPDARTIVVDPWDKSLVAEVEKSIRNSGKGLNPVNEGNFLRIVIPALTEESRKELVKLAYEKAEAARIKIRQLRERIKDEILKAEENKEIAEDQRFKLQDSLDKKCADFNANIKEMAEDKEKEVMTV
ncbi:ribosome recycling factor [Patescibacteria group bacterium]|nr:ribosome recycling factor [Patescibacteria group bacterium]